MKYRLRTFTESLPELNKPVHQLSSTQLTPDTLDSLVGNYYHVDSIEKESENFFIPQKRGLGRRRPRHDKFVNYFPTKTVSSEE